MGRDSGLAPVLPLLTATGKWPRGDDDGDDGGRGSLPASRAPPRLHFHLLMLLRPKQLPCSRQPWELQLATGRSVVRRRSWSGRGCGSRSFAKRAWKGEGRSRWGREAAVQKVFPMNDRKAATRGVGTAGRLDGGEAWGWAGGRREEEPLAETSTPSGSPHAPGSPAVEVEVRGVPTGGVKALLSASGAACGDLPI